MEEKIGKLIDALVETVQKMDDRATRESVSDNPGNLADAFRKTDAQKERDSNRESAKLNAEENARLRKKEEEAKGRKILAQVTPVNITSFDQKALKQLASISPTAEKTAKEASKKEADTSGFEFMDILKGLGYAFVALVVAPIVAFFAFFKEIGKQKWFIALKNMLKSKFWEPIKKFFKPITDFFTRIKNSKFIKSMMTTLDDIWIGIKNFGRRIRDFFKPVTRMFAWIGNLFGGGKGGPGVFMKIMNYFNPAKNPVVKGILTFAKGLGATLGKLFLPITIIMGVIDGVMGFMKGYEEKGDLLGGIQGALTGVVNGLIMLPLDLLKDGLSWILNAVGLESASKWLDSFSFQEMFGELSDVLFGNIRKAWSNLTKNFTDLWDSFFGEGEGIDWKKAFGSVLKIFYTIPVYLADLIKDGISMVLGWFGVDTTWLDSFDIMDIFNDTVDWFMGFLGDIVDWFGLLFTSPSEAFKQIGDWFDKLFDDPVGTIKDLLPEWLFNVGKWIWDHTLGPVVDLWNAILGNPEGAKQAFLNLMPEWLRDIAEWVWDRTIGPAVDLWNFIFDHPDGVKGAIKALMPEWLWDIGKWVWENTIGPAIDAISNFFGKLFDGDIVGAFKAILPDWLLDFFSWLSDTLFAPVGQWFSDQWAKVTEIGALVKKHLKKEYPTVYDWFFGEEEEAERENKKKQEAAQKALEGQGLDSTSAAAISEAVAEASAKAGGNNYESAVEKFTDDMWDIIEAGDSTDAQTFLDNLNAKGTEKGSASYAFYDYLKKSGIDTSNKQAVLAQAKWFSSQFESGRFNDTVSDEGTARLASAGMTYANLLKKDAQINAAVEKGMEMFNTAGLPLGGENITSAMLGSLVVTDAMQAQLKTIESDAAKKYAEWKSIGQGSTSPPPAEEILMRVFKKAGLYKLVTTAKDVKKIGVVDLTTTESTTSNDLVNKKGLPPGGRRKLDDFIMRPGQDPVAFNKGDILLGIHKDNPPATGGSPDLINRVDQMVITLKENKDLQAKMLEAMVESGMMDKQGNTVVNNGGNSTVVNNTTVESNIMSFRDRAVGRISNTSTKY